MLKIYEMYIADTFVSVMYFTSLDIIHITNIYVPKDNRNLYKTRTKELDDQIIKFIEEDVREDAKKEETV